MENKDVFAQNLKIARNLSGLSQQKLAEQAGVSKQAISQYEKGAMLPNSTVLLKIAAALQQKIDFFFRSLNSAAPKISFRKKSKLSAKSQKILAEQANIFLEKYLFIERILGEEKDFKNPIASIKIHTPEDVEQAAAMLRQAWGLSLHPISDVCALLEREHVKIFEQAIDAPNESKKSVFDGLSLVIDGKISIIFSNSSPHISAFRRRFTLLHELGHTLLQIDEEAADADVERFCNRFAAAVLLPKEILIEELGKERAYITAVELKSLQKRYGLSLSSLLYRCYDLGIITQAYFRKALHDANNPDGENHDEKERAERFVSMVYRAASLELISMSKAAELLNVDLMTVRQQLQC